MNRIRTTTEAASMADIDETWKIVGRRFLRTVSGEVSAIWDYTGTLEDSHENRKFRALAFPTTRGGEPFFSVVTGRDEQGVLCLYARIYPQNLRRPRERPSHL